MNTYKRFDVSFKQGRGCWLWDVEGKKYLDAVSGIATCCLGHSDRVLRRNLSRQLKKIQHISNLYQIEEQTQLSKLLTQNSCAEAVFFCNSGAEANEAAIKLIKKYGDQNNKQKESIILASESSFHGRTIAALSATGQPNYQKGFGPLLSGFKFFKYNNFDTVKKLFEECEKNDQQVAGILIEPIQGEGGVIPGNKDFFKQLRNICNEKNTLLIFDEVQSGVGRTGRMWGYENLDIEPDGFTIAKGLGGGHAIGALLVGNKANIFKPGDHASTFGGNPFACTAAITVLNEINRRDLLDNVSLRGKQLEEGLDTLENTYPNIISGHRGIGLLQGIVLDEQIIDSKQITLNAFDQGLLIVPAGGNVVRIIPPLTISKNEIKKILDKLTLIFRELKI
tara:strand:- start:262 stop:1443 length:1182 start_codon:yes stop_codon:yes gene_type:complete